MRWSILVAIVAVSCGSEDGGRPVRASLSDGQVMSGEVRTDVLRLSGDLGTLEIPLGDIGEVVPTEGAQLGTANGNVTVWLRDGSELVGRWADPELTVGIDVGGKTVDVKLPMDALTRFQTRAGPIPPEAMPIT